MTKSPSVVALGIVIVLGIAGTSFYFGDRYGREHAPVVPASGTLRGGEPGAGFQNLTPDQRQQFMNRRRSFMSPSASPSPSTDTSQG